MYTVLVKLPGSSCVTAWLLVVTEQELLELLLSMKQRHTVLCRKLVREPKLTGEVIKCLLTQIF